MNILYDEKIDGKLHHVDRAELMAAMRAAMPDPEIKHKVT